LNTLGTILLRRATSSETRDGETRYRYWKEANEALRESKAMAAGEFAHPFMTFFTYSHKLMDEASRADRRLVEEIKDAFLEWYADAEESGQMNEDYVKSAAEAFPKKWRR
jgi:uncharacterized protein with von Willebrand factor type A (vWA) domain